MHIAIGEINSYKPTGVTWVDACVLSGSYHLLVYCDDDDGDKLKAKVVQISGDSLIFYDEVEIDASASAGCSCCEKDTDEAFVFWSSEPYDNTLTGVWIERNGTSITVKTPTVINDPINEVKERTRCCQLDTDKALLVFRNTENGTSDKEIWAIAVSPNADGIQVGAALILNDDVSAEQNDTDLDVTAMDTDVAIAAYWYAGAPNEWEAHKITVAALVVTDANSVTSGVSSGAALSLGKISATAALILVHEVGTGLIGRVLDISGAITKSATALLDASGTSSHAIERMDDTHAMCLYRDQNDNIFYMVLATMAAGVVTFSIKTPMGEGVFYDNALTLISATATAWRMIAFYSENADLQRAAMVQYRLFPAATDYLGMGGVEDHFRLVDVGDAEYVNVRMYTEGVEVVDCVTPDDNFNPYPLRLYTDALYVVRNEEEE